MDRLHEFLLGFTGAINLQTEWVSRIDRTDKNPNLYC